MILTGSILPTTCPVPLVRSVQSTSSSMTLNKYLPSVVTAVAPDPKKKGSMAGRALYAVRLGGALGPACEESGILCQLFSSWNFGIAFAKIVVADGICEEVSLESSLLVVRSVPRQPKFQSQAAAQSMTDQDVYGRAGFAGAHFSTQLSMRRKTSLYVRNLELHLECTDGSETRL